MSFFKDLLVTQIYVPLILSLLLFPSVESAIPWQNSPAIKNMFGLRAAAGIDTLQQWYNLTTGLWDTTGWWNSANALTTIADYTVLNMSYSTEAGLVFSNTFVNAQKQSLSYLKRVNKDMITTYTWPNIPPGLSSLARTESQGFQSFLNDYYDDEGWWALAWLKAFDVTGEEEYLQAAMDIFEDMKAGTDTTCGGIWWDKSHSYNSAIANELFFAVAAHLANRSTSKQYHLSWAQKQWEWFQASGLINRNSNINDGLNSTCQNNNSTVWSYNQGVVLGGLVELNKAAPNSSSDSSPLAWAELIANAAIRKLCDGNGTLHDPCEPNCGGDGSQFKGIFMRNLQTLQEVVPKPLYADVIKKNAESIWSRSRDVENRLGLVWSGPYTNSTTASTQSSACDALIAAAAMSPSALNPRSPCRAMPQKFLGT